MSSIRHVDGGKYKALPRCALELCLPRAAGAWVSPAPGSVRSAGTLTALNLLLLFMALCCFLVPQLLSVSFQPQAVYVARPQRRHLGSRPLGSVLFREVPACCLQPGLSRELPGAAHGHSASCQQSRRGGEGAGRAPPGELRPGWPAEGPPSPCPFFLSSRSLFPKNSPGELSPRPLLSLWVGEGRAAHFCPAPGEQAPRPGQAGTQRQTPSEGAVRPCSAAAPPLLTGGLGGTRTLESSYPGSCAVGGAVPPAGRPSSSRLRSCRSDCVSNKKIFLPCRWALVFLCR